MIIKIGYFQFLPEFFEVRKNLEEIKNLLAKNQEEVKKLDLIVFPEYFLSGPLKLGLLKKFEGRISSDEILFSLKEISKSYSKVVFVMGSILLKQKGKYSNTSIVIKNKKILATYSKKALVGDEDYVCQSNNKNAIFEVKKIKVGLAICWDMILPEIFRQYAQKVELVVVPSFWAISASSLQKNYSFSLEKKYYAALGIARAYENSFALLFVNSVGKYESSFYSDRMMGGSYFVNPPLGIIHKTNNKDPHVLHFIEFDTKPLEQYKKHYATDENYLYCKTKKLI